MTEVEEQVGNSCVANAFVGASILQNVTLANQAMSAVFLSTTTHGHEKAVNTKMVVRRCIVRSIV